MKFTYTRPVVNGFIAAHSARVHAMFASSSAGSAHSERIWRLNGAPRSVSDHRPVRHARGGAAAGQQ